MEIQRTRLRSYIIIHWGIGVFILLSLIISLLNYAPPGDYVTLLSWSIVLLFCWCLYSWKRVTSNLFNPYILFLLSVMLFNAGQAFLEVIGSNSGGYLDVIFSSDTIAKTLFLSLLSIYAMHWFALMALSRVKITEPQVEEPAKYKSLRTTGLILLEISFIPAISMLKRSIQTVLSYGYMGLYQGDRITGFNNIDSVLAAFLIPSAMFLLAGSINKRWSLYLSLIVLLTYTSTLFFLGNRSLAIMPIVSYFWLFDRTIKKINRMTLFFCGSFITIIVFPLVRSVRGLAGGEKFSIDFLIQYYFSLDNPVIDIIREMGGSMFTVAHTIQLFPSVREYDIGESYFYSLLTFVPNLFWEVHPSVSHTYASWLVWEVDPAAAARGNGYGFSCIAEAYANFGWLAPIFMGLVGGLLVKFYRYALMDSAKLAMVASFLAFFFIFARGESIFIARSILWYAIIPYILYLVIQTVYKRKLTVRKPAIEALSQTEFPPTA